MAVLMVITGTMTILHVMVHVLVRIGACDNTFVYRRMGAWKVAAARCSIQLLVSLLASNLAADAWKVC
jgi:hypothetical protein